MRAFSENFENGDFMPMKKVLLLSPAEVLDSEAVKRAVTRYQDALGLNRLEQRELDQVCGAFAAMDPAHPKPVFAFVNNYFAFVSNYPEIPVDPANTPQRYDLTLKEKEFVDKRAAVVGAPLQEISIRSVVAKYNAIPNAPQLKQLKARIDREEKLNAADQAFRDWSAHPDCTLKDELKKATGPRPIVLRCVTCGLEESPNFEWQGLKMADGVRSLTVSLPKSWVTNTLSQTVFCSENCYQKSQAAEEVKLEKTRRTNAANVYFKPLNEPNLDWRTDVNSNQTLDWSAEMEKLEKTRRANAAADCAKLAPNKVDHTADTNFSWQPTEWNQVGKTVEGADVYFKALRKAPECSLKTKIAGIFKVPKHLLEPAPLE